MSVSLFPSLYWWCGGAQCRAVARKRKKAPPFPPPIAAAAPPTPPPAFPSTGQVPVQRIGLGNGRHRGVKLWGGVGRSVSRRRCVRGKPWLILEFVLGNWTGLWQDGWFCLLFGRIVVVGRGRFRRKVDFGSSKFGIFFATFFLRNRG